MVVASAPRFGREWLVHYDTSVSRFEASTAEARCMTRLGQGRETISSTCTYLFCASVRCAFAREAGTCRRRPMPLRVLVPLAKEGVVQPLQRALRVAMATMIWLAAMAWATVVGWTSREIAWTVWGRWETALGGPSRGHARLALKNCALRYVD